MADIDLTDTPLHNIVAITGGFLIPAEDTHVGLWCRQVDRLQHDDFLPNECAKHIPLGGVAIDAGSFIGDHAVKYSEVLGEEGILIAIEPNPRIFPLLAHNCALFRNHNTLPMNVALGSEMGSCEIETPSANLGMSHVAKVNVATDSTIIGVRTLDSIARNVTSRKVDFIKLDIEGSELDALLGATDILTNDRPIIVLEMNSVALSQHGASYEQIWELLTRHHYQWRTLQPEISDPHSPQYDLLCWPSPPST